MRSNGPEAFAPRNRIPPLRDLRDEEMPQASNLQVVNQPAPPIARAVVNFDRMERDMAEAEPDPKTDPLGAIADCFLDLKYIVATAMMKEILAVSKDPILTPDGEAKRLSAWAKAFLDGNRAASEPTVRELAERI